MVITIELAHFTGTIFIAKMDKIKDAVTSLWVKEFSWEREGMS